MRKLPWLNLRKKTDPEGPYEPPIMLGNKSNGEFFWEQTPRERKIRDLILKTADERARYLGMDRRHFMASALGMTTSLWAINVLSGCAGSDGGYEVGQVTTCEEGTEKLSGDEFIFDIQTHRIEDEETWKERHPGGTYTGNGFAAFLTLYPCELEPRSECIGPTSYVENVFLNSNTTVAVWWLDDEAIATPFIEKCIELGEPLVCSHKGFPLPGFDREHADPRDVGPAAVRYPNVNFVVYHSAFDAAEGP